MKYIEAPAFYDPSAIHPAVFLAGGITDCPDWQADMVGLLDGLPLTTLNPRRADFPIGDPADAQIQIAWEHYALRDADIISFWFPYQTLCPIALYELGAWSVTGKPICIGVHSAYQRKQDVEIQTALARPEVKIVDNLHALADKIKAELASVPLINLTAAYVNNPNAL